MSSSFAPINARSLPHDDAAEKSVLGAMLLNSKAFEDVSEILTPSDFYHTPHQVLYSAIVEYKTSVNTQSLDTIVLYNYLKEKNLLDKCGGISYISSLTNDISASAQAALYADIVHKNATRRRLIESCSNCEAEAVDYSRDIYQVIDEHEQLVSKIGETIGGRSDVSISDFVTKAFLVIQKKLEGTYVDNVVPTGLERLDSLLDGGFRPTDLAIIAARPSIGKTAFALSLIKNICLTKKECPKNERIRDVNGDWIVPPDFESKYKVAFFSLETSGLQISERLLSAASNVPYKTIRMARFASVRDQKISDITTACENLSNAKLSIFDTPNMKLTEIRAAARRLKREKGLDIIFIDYIGLVDAGLEATIPRFEQVAYVSRNLKALARELEIPVVVLCQVNRDAEGDVKEPQLNNLRDSGAIEQDADLVAFLHRSRKANLDNMVKDKKTNLMMQPTKVIVAKNRNGETGSFTVAFKRECVCFENTEVEYVEEANEAVKRGPRN